jgi:hypothetical protein
MAHTVFGELCTRSLRTALKVATRPLDHTDLSHHFHEFRVPGSGLAGLWQFGDGWQKDLA